MTEYYLIIDLLRPEEGFTASTRSGEAGLSRYSKRGKAGLLIPTGGYLPIGGYSLLANGFQLAPAVHDGG